MSGVFVVFEGADGVGKSSLIKRIAEILQEKYYHTKTTREPGGTEWGKKVRELLFDPLTKKTSMLTQALLVSADRAEHMDKVIFPALDEYEVVISDRWVWSTLVYQDGVEDNKTLAEIATRNVRADLVVLVEAPEEEAFARMKKAAEGNPDRINWLDGNREEWRQRARLYRKYIVEVGPNESPAWGVLIVNNSDGQMEKVAQDIASHIAELCENPDR